MAPSPSWHLLIVTLISTTLFISCSATSEEDRQSYIVYMGDLPKDRISVPSFHTSMLEEVVGGTSSASKYLIRSYKKSFNGFVAELTKKEVKRLSGNKGVVSVFPNEKMQLLTTRSWDFLGFPEKVSRSTTESDIIIGILDSGIWPESKSFNDKGFGPPPKKWKGDCKSGNFTCNNKIIGARYYRSHANIPEGEFESARDADGHGTHIASIAAGGIVKGASMLGVAKGTVRGGVPSARIAVYKICWFDGCYAADVLAGFDDAIADGVDVISVCVGSYYGSNYPTDPVAIGAFHSMKNGILTANAAGNLGSFSSSLLNFSPWSLTVAASTIDRKFLTKLRLGNNQTFEDDAALNTFNMKDMVPLIYGGDAPNKARGFASYESRYCSLHSLDKSLVRGKIVFCDDISHDDPHSDDQWSNSGEAQQAAGAAGTIIVDNHYEVFPSAHPLPISRLNESDMIKIHDYINSSSQPTAKIERTTSVKHGSTPVVAEFSSRGPNRFTPDLLSPDITAPGVHILAAWAGTPLFLAPHYKRVVKYNIAAGTSISCSHASAAAAYVKSFHPTWSPAAIKSALMTTATQLGVESCTSLEFGYGAGQLNPVKAANPGLVYDAGVADYVKFLCGQGYSDENLRLIAGDNSTCTEATNGTVWDLNLPAFSLSCSSGTTVTRTFSRTVTNVGSAVSNYKAKVTDSSGLTVEVEPSVLTFKSIGQKQTFKVTATAAIKDDGVIVSGSLVWDDGVFQVRSPIVAHSPMF